MSTGLDTNTGEPKGHTCIYYYQQLSEGSAGVRVSEAKMTHRAASAMEAWDMCLPPSKHFVQRPPVNKRPSKYGLGQAPGLETTTPTRPSGDRSSHAREEVPGKVQSWQEEAAPLNSDPPKPQPLLGGQQAHRPARAPKPRTALLKAHTGNGPGLSSHRRWGEMRGHRARKGEPALCVSTSSVPGERHSPTLQHTVPACPALPRLLPGVEDRQSEHQVRPHLSQEAGCCL